MSTPIQGISASAIQAVRPAPKTSSVSKTDAPATAQEPASVSISTAAQALAEQSSPLPPDMEKVAKFQQMIADGSYQTDSRSIAERMVGDAVRSR